MDVYNREVSENNKTILLMVALLLSSLALIFSFWGIYTKSSTGTTGQTGTSGAAGATGTTGQTGTSGAAGATGSFLTSGYHEATVCVRANGQFDGFKDAYGGTGICPSGDSVAVIVVKTQ